MKRISAEASPKDRDAFLKEASMMSKLEHDNIVRFIGVSVQPQEKGRSVKQKLKGRKKV